MEALGGRGGEVGEEGEAPGLAEQGPHVAPVGAGEAQRPEHAELDHARPRYAARFRGSRAVWGRRYGRRDGRITRARRGSPKLAPQPETSPVARARQSQLPGET